MSDERTCDRCDWRGDYEHETDRRTELVEGVWTEVWVCPRCGNEDFLLDGDIPEEDY
jgi:hypothetical protein